MKILYPDLPIRLMWRRKSTVLASAANCQP